MLFHSNARRTRLVSEILGGTRERKKDEAIEVWGLDLHNWNDFHERKSPYNYYYTVLPRNNNSYYDPAVFEDDDIEAQFLFLFSFPLLFEGGFLSLQSFCFSLFFFCVKRDSSALDNLLFFTYSQLWVVFAFIHSVFVYGYGWIQWNTVFTLDTLFYLPFPWVIMDWGDIFYSLFLVYLINFVRVARDTFVIRYPNLFFVHYLLAKHPVVMCCPKSSTFVVWEADEAKLKMSPHVLFFYVTVVVCHAQQANTYDDRRTIWWRTTFCGVLLWVRWWRH